MRIGIIGVGTISAAIVDGILSGPRVQRAEFILSPRSADRVSALCSRHERVRVAPSNQAVLDDCDVVLLAVLPSQLHDVCSGLRFRADHVVASLAAGWSVEAVRAIVEPANTVCQLIPLPLVRLHIGPIVLFPDVQAVRDLFDGVGNLIVPKTQSETAAFSSASATMSMLFSVHGTIVDWLTRNGASNADAYTYVTSLFSGLMAEALNADAAERATLVDDHETSGGLNQQVREFLQRAGFFTAISAELDRILQRVQ